MNEPLAITAREAAAALSISERTLFTLTKTGRLAAVRIGKAVRYDIADLRAFMDANKTNRNSEPTDVNAN